MINEAAWGSLPPLCSGALDDLPPRPRHITLTDNDSVEALRRVGITAHDLEYKPVSSFKTSAAVLQEVAQLRYDQYEAHRLQMFEQARAALENIRELRKGSRRSGSQGGSRGQGYRDAIVAYREQRQKDLVRYMTTELRDIYKRDRARQKLRNEDYAPEPMPVDFDKSKQWWDPLEEYPNGMPHPGPNRTDDQVEASVQAARDARLQSIKELAECEQNKLEAAEALRQSQARSRMADMSQSVARFERAGEISERRFAAIRARAKRQARHMAETYDRARQIEEERVRRIEKKREDAEERRASQLQQLGGAAEAYLEDERRLFESRSQTAHDELKAAKIRRDEMRGRLDARDREADERVQKVRKERAIELAEVSTGRDIGLAKFMAKRRADMYAKELSLLERRQSLFDASKADDARSVASFSLESAKSKERVMFDGVKKQIASELPRVFQHLNEADRLGRVAGVSMSDMGSIIARAKERPPRPASAMAERPKPM